MDPYLARADVVSNVSRTTRDGEGDRTLVYNASPHDSPVLPARQWMICLVIMLCGAIALPFSPAFGQEADVESPLPLPSGELLAPVSQDDAARVFRQKCAGCHTVGGGASAGPDLKGVQGRPDEEIAAAVRRMQDRVGPLTDTEVTELTGLLQDPAAAERIAAQEQLAAKAAVRQLAPPSADRGRQLFEGRRRLQHGGLACTACHRVNGRGGTIGMDLTGTTARIGPGSLPSAIQQASFPLMKDAYKNHPITPQEAADIAAYLNTVQATPLKPTADDAVPWLAVAGALALFGLMAVSYRKRNAGVRARLQRRSNALD